MKKLPGYTIIEILVVISIIGLISTFAAVMLNDPKIKSRDAKRLADVREIQSALVLYYNDNGVYPAALTPDNPIASGTTYLARYPKAPNNGETYAYSVTNTPPATYSIVYALERTTNGIGQGTHHATPAGLVND